MEAPPNLEAAATLAGRRIEADVPGCVHADLIRAGLLPDPYLAANELAARWIGDCHWRYSARFEAGEEVFGAAGGPGDARLDLVFDGIDTLAVVQLNAFKLGRVDNMHATWRFDVRQNLQRGGNRLEMDFPAPLAFCRDELKRYQREIGDFPAGGAGANPQLPQHMLRKMHCNFGWDWGPQLVTCGIWRRVRLEVWDSARIASVRPRIVETSPDRALVEVNVDLEWAQNAAPAAAPRLELELLDPEGRAVASESSDGNALTVAMHLSLMEPHLWWPAGQGDQPLYALVVSLRDPSSGTLLDRTSRRIGLRTFQWITAPDDTPTAIGGSEQRKGATFHLRVNGRRVFCKGANWIPDDCFPHRVSRTRYHRRVQQARDANMNMLRVWGGGIYESDAFYDACDELGIMVWQDFATACSAYPEDDVFKRRFEQEARDNVTRLAGRPSLALWCGGNECIQAVHDWGNEYRRLKKAGYGWGKYYWYELFPRIVSELDPGTFYWPNSPWSAPEGEGAELPPNLENIGDQHIWDVWNGQGDWRNYWSHTPRFASEFGFHGPPSWPTLAAAVPEAQRHWFSETMVLHNKQDGGQQRAIDRARDHFRLPDRPESPESFEAMWFVAALNQARAIQAGCQWFRALSPWCGGALYWQLNDCWPVSSWSAIDNDNAGVGRPKLLWYATRRFFAPRMCALLPASASPATAGDFASSGTASLPSVYLHNAFPYAWHSDLHLRLLTFDGQALRELTTPFEVEPGGSKRVMIPGDWPPAADRLIVAEAEGAARATWFFARDKELPYPAPEFELCARLEGARTLLSITAQKLVRDLCIFADRLDPAARLNEQLLTLLPGETATLSIEAPRLLSPSELLAPGVIWTANQFGAA